MQGYWTSPNLVDVHSPLLSQHGDYGQAWMRALLEFASGCCVYSRRVNINSLSGSRRNISAHYDLGNEFFNLFLDPTMMYSAAVYPSADASLEQASLHKLDLLCQQLELKSGGPFVWKSAQVGGGGMAIFAAQNYGCRVTTTTISREQYKHASDQVRELGLEDQITCCVKTTGN